MSIQIYSQRDQRVSSDIEGHGLVLKSTWLTSIASNMPFSVSAQIFKFDNYLHDILDRM